jgi:hypothetical protein
MDIVYLALAATFWLATVGFAAGCERLQAHKVAS